MANASRYEFTFEEIATALTRHLHIHEGLWTLSANFKYETKNLTMQDKQTRPGLLAVLDHLSLVRVTAAIPGLTIDAAHVNPRVTTATETRRKAH